jgi:hypothetical protein
MFLKRRFAALTAVTAALAVPVASATAATSPVNDWGIGSLSGLGSPRCPDGYAGPTNLATGCPWWMIH